MAARAATCLVIVGLVFCLLGCAVGPNYKTPTIAVPTLYASVALDQSASSDNTASWWRTLGDPELNSLVERAIRANLDVAVALARVQEARERDIATFGTLSPVLGLAGGIAEGSGTEAVKGRIPPSLDAGTNGRGLQEITGVGGFDAIWELDLFGK